MAEPAAKITRIFAMPHFHFDVEWWKTEDGYNRDVEEILDRALDMLERHPEFTYVIDQALALKPYWDTRPETREKIRKFIGEGRLELVGGTWCSPDENIPTGEALVRQYVYGRRFMEGVVGGKVTTAWEVDSFGHPSQFPQIMAGAGMKGFVFARGIQQWRSESEPVQFYWEAPDGTRILTNWFAAHYIGLMLATPSPAANMRLFNWEMKARTEYEGARVATDILMAPFGTDFMPPAEDWLPFVESWNLENNARIEFSLPARFFETLENEYGDKLQNVRGEFNPLLTGCYESREKVKNLCRRSQYSMIDAEKWASIAWISAGGKYPAAELDRAWELILENDFHDIVCGTGTDKVYANTMKRYEEALEKIEIAGSAARKSVARLADTTGPGAPLVVFNSLNWDRRETVTVPLNEIGIEPGDEPIVIDPRGFKTPAAVSDDSLIFTASMRPVSFGVYKVSTRGQAEKKMGNNARKGRSANAKDMFPGADPQLKIDGLTAENSYLRITLDGKTGCIASIFDKELGKEMLDTNRRFGNELLSEEDAGNLWTVQKTGLSWDGKKYRSQIEPIDESPVRVGFETAGRHHEMKCSGKIYLSALSRRIDFETEIEFQGKDRRVKAMFAPAFSGQPVFETPFYSQPREQGHHCAQNWVDISNGRRGLAVINSGNPGMEIIDGEMGLVLFRSVSVASPALFRFLPKERREILRGAAEAAGYMARGLGLNIGEWAFYKVHGMLLREWSSAGGPPTKGLSIADHFVPWLKFNEKSDAWEQGAHRFRYALYPHEGDWRAARLPQIGWEFNTPPSVIVARPHKGKLGSEATLFDTGGGDAILTALKRSETGDALAARLYDSHGKGATIRLSLPDRDIECRKTNLVEEPQAVKLKHTKSGASDRLRPWEIATYVIRGSK